MVKENQKSKNAYSGKDLERYLGALAETHNEHLKGIKEAFYIVDKRFDEVDKKLNQHTEMIGILMEDVSVLKEDTSVLKDDMQIVKKELKKKVDYDEFSSLVQRVNKLEAKM